MDKRGFTIIENSILDDERLTVQDQSVLISIISYFNKDKGYSYPSYVQLKKRSKVIDNRTLKKCINSLIEKGYIRKETIKGLGCKYYILKPSGELHLVENYTKCKSTLPPSVKVHHDLVENYTTTNTNTNTNTNIYTLNQIKSKGINNSKDIEEIWKLYPNKKGKVKSVGYINKILKSISRDELVRCIDRYKNDVEIQRANGFKNLNYMNGSTFFNGRYEDYLDKNYEEIKQIKNCTIDIEEELITRS
ncbi:helix-turn-helix domain-containing protein [Caproiciproducens sp. MSJ-32]|uniref:helix-turn-helix domain-containing protein n=1 Tax=Caproiciproducens sp. MSJ-32 TaxID=2841527 RepID=UPI001C0F58BB|nr:helix-turn-helix domain-containing protein [Caproiciproducens sp. MSJ-32]MBU5454538.1 helix-turn-helix domain-containing protein [Caproiciproducens sp. MSJ-32]